MAHLKDVASSRLPRTQGKYDVLHGYGLPRPGVFERVGSKVSVIPETGCWVYNAKPDEYSLVYVEGAIQKLAHRFVWEVLRGPIPDGYHLHHHCHVKGCVNPDHLEPLEPSEHMRLHGDERRASA